MADDEVGLPDDLGLPEDIGLPDDVGLSENVGNSDELGLPDDIGETDKVGLPDDLGMPEDVGMPDDELGLPDEGKDLNLPSETTLPEDLGASNEDGLPDELGSPQDLSGDLGALEEHQRNSNSAVAFEQDDEDADNTGRRSSEVWQMEAEKRLLRSRESRHRPTSVDEAIRKSLFGGQIKRSQLEKTSEKPRMTISASERADIQKRILTPKPPTPVPQLDQECTFKPVISEASKGMGAKGDEPRYLTLASENKAKIEKRERAHREQEDRKVSECSFKPDLGYNTQAFPQVAAKYLEQKPRPEPVPEEISTPKPASPRKPRTPFTPQPRDSPHAGEQGHMARAQAARDLNADRQSRIMRPIDESQWQGRRATTTPQPFCSHTGLRKQQRELEKQGPVVEKINEQLFKELHKQLHSLDLGGPQW